MAKRKTKIKQKHGKKKKENKMRKKALQLNIKPIV